MPNPFSFLTDPDSQAAPLFDVLAIGNRTRQRNQEYDREMDERRLMGGLQTKAAELAGANPNASHAQLLGMLLQDPMGAEAVSSLPKEKLNSVFTDTLKTLRPAPTFQGVGQDQSLFRFDPNDNQLSVAGQGQTEQTVVNPMGKPIGTQMLPAQTFQPGAPAPQGPQGNILQNQPEGLTNPQAQQPGDISSAPELSPQQLNAIIQAEGTGFGGVDPYNTVLGYGKYGSPEKPLTEMTLTEVKNFGRKMRASQARNGIPWDQTSSATGAFQITGTTIQDAQTALGLPDSTIFTPAVQRQMATWIARTQGPGAWEGFKKNPDALSVYQGADAQAGPQPRQTTYNLFAEDPNQPSGPVSTMEATDAVEQHPATMFLGAGVLPWAYSKIGMAGRQLDLSADLENSRIVSLNRKKLDTLRYRVMDTTTEGSRFRTQVEAAKGMVPDMGVGADPLTALDQGMFLRQYAEGQQSRLREIFNNPAYRGTELQQDAGVAMEKWSSVLQALPPLEDMEALAEDLKQNPGTWSGRGEVTVGSLIRNTKKFLSAEEKKVSNPREPTSNPRAGAAGPGAPVPIRSEDEYNALPPGTPYIDPEGNRRTKRGGVR